MCDSVRDGQIGHDFTAVGEVGEIDPTQPRGTGGFKLRARRIELHNLAPPGPAGIAVDDHSRVASVPRQVAKRDLVGAGVVVQRDLDVSGIPSCGGNFPFLSWPGSCPHSAGTGARCKYSNVTAPLPGVGAVVAGVVLGISVVCVVVCVQAATATADRRLISLTARD